MNQEALNELRYPIGKFIAPEAFDKALVKEAIQHIETLPQLIMAKVSGWDAIDFSKTYRPEGWSATQVIHHLADSHLNSFLRFKQAYLNDGITIMSYDEKAWAAQEDAQLPAESSLQILIGLHKRWSTFLKTFKDEDWKKTFYNPGYDLHFPLWLAVALYAWHGQHHLAHLELCEA